MTLPTNRTTANTPAEHVNDHNVLHALHNILEGSTVPSTVTSAQVAAKAADSAVVHNTGNETVAGVKTFSSSPIVPDGSWSIADTAGLQSALDAKSGSNGSFSPLNHGGVAGGSSAVNKPAVSAAFAAAAATTYGAEVVFPPGVWDVADLAIVAPGGGKTITLSGAGPDATYLYFSTDRAAGTFALSGPGLRIRNMSISGPGTSFVMGVSPANLRGVKMESRTVLENVVLAGFHAGAQIVGDHTFMKTVKALNNFYGLYFADATTAGDNTHIDCDLSGNLRASVGVATTGVMDASTWLRGHLGYSPFCIEFEAGGASQWVGMVNSQFLGTAWEYAGNGHIYNSDRNVLISDVLITQARPWTSNAAFKIAALAVQPDFYLGYVDGMRITGDGPTQMDCIVIRGSTWEGWKAAFARSVAAGVAFIKANMGLSGLSGTLLLTESNSRATAFNVLSAVTAGQVVEHTASPHYVQPHNPSGTNGGSMIAGVALTAATSGTDVCIAVAEDYEGATPIKVAGAGPYGANDILFAVGTAGAVDNAAGAGGGYQDLAMVGRVAGVTAVSGGKLAGVIIKITDRPT